MCNQCPTVGDFFCWACRHVTCCNYCPRQVNNCEIVNHNSNCHGSCHINNQRNACPVVSQQEKSCLN
ncbi:MAG: hypothetical protein MJ054_02365, partial [Clostridia bacterium]|nr:hypothetical protein [Clostridia bacterium]